MLFNVLHRPGVELFTAFGELLFRHVCGRDARIRLGFLEVFELVGHRKRERISRAQLGFDALELFRDREILVFQLGRCEVIDCCRQLLVGQVDDRPHHLLIRDVRQLAIRERHVGFGKVRAMLADEAGSLGDLRVERLTIRRSTRGRLFLGEYFLRHRDPAGVHFLVEIGELLLGRVAEGLQLRCVREKVRVKHLLLVLDGLVAEDHVLLGDLRGTMLLDLTDGAGSIFLPEVGWPERDRCNEDDHERTEAEEHLFSILTTHESLLGWFKRQYPSLGEKLVNRSKSLFSKPRGLRC